MRVATSELLQAAEAGGYAIGAFNVYNLEGVRAVVGAAEAAHSPALLQLHPGALRHGGGALIAACLAAVAEAAVPMNVHLDHSASPSQIAAGLQAGLTSVMADGSHLPYAENLAFTREMVALARAHGAEVEAELGRISGTEDGLSVAEFEARFTDPEQAAGFVAATGVDALAVCIGNVHGPYPREPELDLQRLSAIRRAVSVPLVLHGASGLPEALVRQAIELGVRKFNVNTELRVAYVAALKARLVEQAEHPPALVDLMEGAVAAMQAVVAAKLRLFGSVGRAAV